MEDDDKGGKEKPPQDKKATVTERAVAVLTQCAGLSKLAAQAIVGDDERVADSICVAGKKKPRNEHVRLVLDKRIDKLRREERDENGAREG